MTIDLRSAGLFRVTLGTVLLVHAWQRWTAWPELFSADGFLTADRLIFSQELPYCPSLLVWLESTACGVEIFQGLALAAYVLFLLGWQTRLATFASLLAFSTVAHRNPYLVIGTDEVIGSMLLWSSLLPLGAKFSIDARLASHRSPTASSHSSLAAFGVLLQICLIYLATAWQKSGETWWSEGTALMHVLGLATFQRPGGELLRLLGPEGLSLLTRGVLVLEYLLPVLILSPYGRPWCRRLAICGLLGLHSGIAVVLETGMFSLTMMALTPLLLTDADWRLLTPRIRACTGEALATTETKSKSPQSGQRWLREAAAAFLVFGLLQLNWNLTFAPPGLRIAGNVLSWPWRFAAAPQRWTMFAPDPPRFDSQVRVRAIMTDGAEVSLWESPQTVAAAEAGDHRFLWMLFLTRIALLDGDRVAEGAALRQQSCRWLAIDASRRWRRPLSDIARIEMWLTSVPTYPPDARDKRLHPLLVANYSPTEVLVSKLEAEQRRRNR